MEAVIEEFRAFNRFYTELLGLLNRTHLQSDYSLAEVRLLFEINHQDGCTASALVQQLGIDPGYLSRLLKVFEKHGLIRRQRRAQDARQVSIHLTPEGKHTFEHLNTRASAQIAELLQPLSLGQRQELMKSLKRVRQLLSGSKPASLELRSPLPGDMGWVVERHGALYAQEFGWNSRFEALVARIVADYLENYRPDRERCWIAEVQGERAGSVFLVQKSPQVAQLRLLLVEPWARGLGLGRRLVESCEAFARTVGYKRITLWTNHVLQAARRIYEAAGYRLLQEEAHHEFGPELTGQHWEKALFPDAQGRSDAPEQSEALAGEPPENAEEP